MWNKIMKQFGYEYSRFKPQYSLYGKWPETCFERWAVKILPMGFRKKPRFEGLYPWKTIQTKNDKKNKNLTKVAVKEELSLLSN